MRGCCTRDDVWYFPGGLYENGFIPLNVCPYACQIFAMIGARWLAKASPAQLLSLDPHSPPSLTLQEPEHDHRWADRKELWQAVSSNLASAAEQRILERLATADQIAQCLASNFPGVKFRRFGEYSEMDGAYVWQCSANHFVATWKGVLAGRRVKIIFNDSEEGVRQCCANEPVYEIAIRSMPFEIIGFSLSRRILQHILTHSTDMVHRAQCEERKQLLTEFIVEKEKALENSEMWKVLQPQDSTTPKEFLALMQCAAAGSPHFVNFNKLMRPILQAALIAVDFPQ